jgi:hypothetical protein
MIYHENIYRWLQVVRLAPGIALAIYGYTAMAGTPIGYVLIAAGPLTALSGVFGFYPACAIVGRKLPQAPQ